MSDQTPSVIVAESDGDTVVITPAGSDVITVDVAGLGTPGPPGPYGPAAIEVGPVAPAATYGDDILWADTTEAGTGDYIGPMGPPGPTGPAGPPGAGVPAGGNPGDQMVQVPSGSTVWQSKTDVDVADYMHLGSDAAAIQAADNAVSAGGTVRFRRRDYNIGATTINKSCSTVWVGQGNHPTGGAAGTELLYTGEAIAVNVANATSAQWYGRIEGMRILYAGSLGAATTATGINVTGGASSQVIRDVQIAAFRDGINCDATSGLRLQMVYVYSATRYGCHIVNTTDCYVGEYTQLSGGVHGLYAENCSSLMVVDSRVQSSGTANAHISGGGYFQMTGGLCDSADVSTIAGDRKGIMLTGVTYSRITGVTFYANGTVADIEVVTPTGAPTQQLNVTGCVFKTGGGAKVAVLFRAPAAIVSRIAIVGNSVDNATEPLVTFEAPTAGGSYNNVTITGNAALGGVVGSTNVASATLRMVGNTGTPGAWTKWTGTQAAYDAIVTKDADTLYVVTG